MANQPKLAPNVKERKPVITAQPASLFGEMPEEVVEDPSTGAFYLPGYSDKRTAIELARQRGREVEVNGVTAKPTDTLKWRLHYVRCKNQPRVAEYRQRGYIPVEYDKLQSTYGIDVALAPNLERGQDGMAYNGGQECLLMAAPAEKAAKHLAKQIAQTQARLETNPYLDEAKDINKRMGGQVYLNPNEPRD